MLKSFARTVGWRRRTYYGMFGQQYTETHLDVAGRKIEGVMSRVVAPIFFILIYSLIIAAAIKAIF